MNKKELLDELEQEFEKLKQQEGFESTLDELDRVFYIRDYILALKYVSLNLERQLAWRIVETYNNWLNYLHSIIMPPPHNMVANAESQQISEEEKQNIMQLMNKVLAHTSTSPINTLKKESQGKFIDNSLKLWNEVQPELLNIMQKINKYWKSRS